MTQGGPLMEKLKRIFIAVAGCSAVFAAGIFTVTAAVQKIFSVKCCRVNYAGQKPGICIIGGAQDGPTAVFVSTKYHPGWSRMLGLVFAAMAAASAGMAALFHFLSQKQGSSR